MTPRIILAPAVLALALTAGLTPSKGSAAEAFIAVPAPAVDATPSNGSSSGATETVVLAGGCFWGVQGVFQHVKGVTRAVSGYAGGFSSTADYEKVSVGNTNHAESVQVTYDPKEISLGKLLQIYFSVVHDPTQLNRQGPDVGSQYRSAVFPANDDQAKVVKAYIAQLDQAKVYKDRVVTRIEMNKAFYPAERYHQDYLTLHPREAYIAYNDIPKVEALAQMYPALYRQDPVLVYEKNKK